MGIIGSRIPRTSWLRYCPVCLQADKERFGERYWHRLHQVPGVEICPTHKTFLENSTFRATAPFPVREFISAEHLTGPSLPRKADSHPLFPTLLDIAVDVSYLLSAPSSFPDTSILEERYCFLLSQRGFMTKGGLVRRVELMKAFADYYAMELLTLLHCEVGKTCHVSDNWPARLVTPSKMDHHPLHNILLIRFLGVAIEKFFLQLTKQYIQQANQHIKRSLPFGDGPWPCLNPVCEHYQRRYVTTHEISKHSEIHRPDHPVGLFTCLCGFAYARKGPDQSPSDIFRKDRILSYGPVWEKELCELWFDPTISLRSLARRLGVDIIQVNRRATELHLPVPRNTPYRTKMGITQRRLTQGEVRSYRVQWLALLDEASSEGVSSLRKKSPQVYEWLYKYDKEWFTMHRPARKFKQRSLEFCNLVF